MKRTLTSIALIAVLAAFMLCGYFVSPIFVDMLILLFLAGATFEMRKCLKDSGYDMYIAPAVIMLIFTYPVFYLMQHYIGDSAGLQGILIVLLVSIAVCIAIFTFRPLMKKKQGGEKADSDDVAPAEVAVGSEPISAEQCCKSENATEKKSINSLFANVFLIAYPMIFMTVAWVVGYKYSALFAVLYAIVVPIIGSDMFAFFAGSLIGGKKLCPSISPKKTVAGAVGGLVGGAAVSVVFWAIFEYVGSIAPEFTAQIGYIPFISHSDVGWMWKSALIYLAIGIICGAVSEVGDLCASGIKRALGIKDYGKIFPGHGGFMDRIDSVMYCLVVLLVAFTCIYGS